MSKIHISGLMVNVLSSSAGIGPSQVKPKIFKLVFIRCFCAKYVALMSKRKDWLPQNQENVSEQSKMSTCKILV
jgi:hypothetical protein